jgi:hypothetical protein
LRIAAFPHPDRIARLFSSGVANLFLQSLSSDCALGRGVSSVMYITVSAGSHFVYVLGR